MTALKQKQAMKMEKNIQAKLERMEIEADIASSDAKLKVFHSCYEGSESQPTVQEKDGMNENEDSYRTGYA